MGLEMPWTPCLSITPAPDHPRQRAHSRTKMLRTLAENSRLIRFGDSLCSKQRMRALSSGGSLHRASPPPHTSPAASTACVHRCGRPAFPRALRRGFAHLNPARRRAGRYLHSWCDDGGQPVVIARVQYLGDGVPDPLAWLRRAELVKHKDLRLADRAKYLHLGRLNLPIVAVLDFLQQLSIIPEES